MNLAQHVADSKSPAAAARWNVPGAAAGIPSVVIGPGSIDQAHKADEFIAESEVAKCVGFIDRLTAQCTAG